MRGRFVFLGVMLAMFGSSFDMGGVMDVKTLSAAFALKLMAFTGNSENGNGHEQHGEKFHRAASYPVAAETQPRVLTVPA